jgi:hypothetical protein
MANTVTAYMSGCFFYTRGIDGSLSKTKHQTVHSSTSHKKMAKKVAIERAGILFVLIGQKILGVGFWFCVQNNAAPPFLYSRRGCLPQQRQRLLGFNKL